MRTLDDVRMELEHKRALLQAIRKKKWAIEDDETLLTVLIDQLELQEERLMGLPAHTQR